MRFEQRCAMALWLSTHLKQASCWHASPPASQPRSLARKPPPRPATPPCRRGRDGHASSSRPDGGHHHHRSDRDRERDRDRDRDRGDRAARSDRDRARDREARERDREAHRQQRAAHLGRLSEFLPQELLSTDVLGHMDMDIEELMLMEGIWRSLQARAQPPGRVGEKVEQRLEASKLDGRSFQPFCCCVCEGMFCFSLPTCWRGRAERPVPRSLCRSPSNRRPQAGRKAQRPMGPLRPPSQPPRRQLGGAAPGPRSARLRPQRPQLRLLPPSQQPLPPRARRPDPDPPPPLPAVATALLLLPLRLLARRASPRAGRRPRLRAPAPAPGPRRPPQPGAALPRPPARSRLRAPPPRARRTPQTLASRRSSGATASCSRRSTGARTPRRRPQRRWRSRCSRLR